VVPDFYLRSELLSADSGAPARNACLFGAVVEAEHPAILLQSVTDDADAHMETPTPWGRLVHDFPWSAPPFALRAVAHRTLQEKK
jgi:hypothetical protein